MPIEVIKQFVDLNDEFEKCRVSIGKRARRLLIKMLKKWLANHPKKAWIKVEAHAVEEINADAMYFDCTSGTQDRQESDEPELASLLWPHGYIIRQGFRVDSRMTVWSRGKIYSYTPKEDLGQMMTMFDLEQIRARELLAYVFAPLVDTSATP